MSEFPFLEEAGPRRILAAIAGAGGEARAVGGAVRDTLLGRAAHEIDFAVTLAPEKTSEALKKAGIKVVPTGIEHGTVTAVVDHKGFELTTLRRDVETDGRRAKVAFTDDWQEDAARRDFTINALYVDAAGKIYDYFDGRADLKAGRVRFIGDARLRIREDVLRILRFFRFYAWFGKGEADKEALEACRELAVLLPTLSFERVGREVIKLLAAPDPAYAWKLLKGAGALAHILPDAANIGRLESLISTEKKYDVAPSAFARLAALLPKDGALAAKAAQRLKFSNKESEKLQRLAVLPDMLVGKLDPVPFRRALYEHGSAAAHDAALLYAAENGAIDLDPALRVAAEWERPGFPIQGEDILKLGIEAGPKVGGILRTVEEWWAEKDFRPTRAECLAEAKRLIAA